LFGFTRKLKKKSPYDMFYFLVPYLMGNYCIFVERLPSLFESGYPAHPIIFQSRTNVVN